MATVNTLNRKFIHGTVTLDDPNPNWTTKQVIDFYVNSYPELVNANVSEPQVVGESVHYTFNTKVGTKG